MENRKETISEKIERLANLPCTETKKKLSSILLLVNWGSVSLDYFGKGHSWLYKKIDGHDTDGNPTETLTEEELGKLKDALKDLAKKINECAEKL